MSEDRAMQKTITLIVMTDFLCWIPFIVVCALHNLGQIDATKWYVNFAMLLLPLNSVINPLIYSKTLRDSLRWLHQKVKAFGTLTNVSSTNRDNFEAEISRRQHQPEIIRMEVFKRPEITDAKANEVYEL
jgi:hypothetical protein